MVPVCCLRWGPTHVTRSPPLLLQANSPPAAHTRTCVHEALLQLLQRQRVWVAHDVAQELPQLVAVQRHALQPVVRGVPVAVGVLLCRRLGRIAIERPRCWCWRCCCLCQAMLSG
jgi:hypothetical protein